ncbi:hypothetical protein MKW98_004465 [Papaver atlanticum]|uniref:C2 domain-containing protein n=1 Tax=Papaver atlanticum TaxID=357466 RepID=A0AAD4SPQ9_9MAGN|nr:hypothetical protein MKW98_004465 [Papaver atlanticum]
MQSPPSSYPYQTPPSITVSGIHGQTLEVTVVGCNRLKDTEWISRQDPYVILEYGTTKFRTRTCTDGGKNPKFQEKFIFSLVEGLHELQISVWNSNTITFDDFIGTGKVQLHKVLTHGYDDTPWPIQSKHGRCTGETRLILHYANAANKIATNFGPSAPPYLTPSTPYGSPPPCAAPYLQYPIPYPYPSAYPPSGYPPSATGYPPPLLPYPPTAYPPPYPPLQGTFYYLPGPYTGPYPPPPY